MFPHWQLLQLPFPPSAFGQGRCGRQARSVPMHSCSRAVVSPPTRPLDGVSGCLMSWHLSKWLFVQVLMQKLFTPLQCRWIFITFSLGLAFWKAFGHLGREEPLWQGTHRFSLSCCYRLSPLSFSSLKFANHMCACFLWSGRPRSHFFQLETVFMRIEIFWKNQTLRKVAVSGIKILFWIHFKTELDSWSRKNHFPGPTKSIQVIVWCDWVWGKVVFLHLLVTFGLV